MRLCVGGGLEAFDGALRNVACGAATERLLGEAPSPDDNIGLGLGELERTARLAEDRLGDGA